MAGTPRTTVEDSYSEGLTCAICGRAELYVQHLPAYPDFVTCRNCGAAFVVEDAGERVMYGKIPDDYPDTSQFALRQWVWLEAVERRAQAERPAPEPAAIPEASLRTGWTESAAAEPEAVEEEAEAPVEEEGPSPDWLAARLMTGGMPAGVPIPTEPEPYRPGSQGVPLAADTGPTDESLPSWLRSAPPPAAPPKSDLPRVAPPPSVVPVVAPVAAAAAAVAEPAAAEEPPAGRRHRVVIRGDRVRMPVNACAHCQRTPAPHRLPVPGSLPRTSGGPARRATTFQVPLCADCNRRAASRTGDVRGSRVMAVLVGALVGLVLVVFALATGVVPLTTNLALSLLLLAVIWLIGFALTAGLMLARGGRQPLSSDAEYVRTTLRVVADPAAPQTNFEWRNAGTALAFSQANPGAAAGGPLPVSESSST